MRLEIKLSEDTRLQVKNTVNTPNALLKEAFSACEDHIKTLLLRAGFVGAVAQDKELECKEILATSIVKKNQADLMSSILPAYLLLEPEIAKFDLILLSIKALAQMEIAAYEEVISSTRSVQSPTDPKQMHLLKKFANKRIINGLLSVLEKMNELKLEASDRAEMPEKDFNEFLRNASVCIARLKPIENAMLMDMTKFPLLQNFAARHEVSVEDRCNEVLEKAYDKAQWVCARSVAGLQR